MPDIFNDFSPRGLVGVIKANLFEHYDYLGHSPAADVHEDGHLKWILTGIPSPFMNNVVKTQLASGEVEEVIRQTLVDFRSRNVTMVSWWAEPGSQPADLGEHLLANGLSYTDGGPGMAVDLQALNELPIPPGFTVQWVEDLEMLRGFARIAAFNFGAPEADEVAFKLMAGLGHDLPLRNYVGYLNGQPVATAELFLGAGVAGIYWVSTLPDVRGLGIGSAVTQVPLQEAREMGYGVGILHSSPLGFGVYRRLGFTEYCRMSHYIWMSE